MVFHESLNPERKFSLAIPLVFIAILGGTTGVVGLATVLSPQASYAVNSLVHAALGAYGYNLYSNLLKRKPKE